MDTSNKFLVRFRPVKGGLAGMVSIERPPTEFQMRQCFAVEDALNLAAWIVAIADPTRERFDRLVAELRGQP